MTKKEIVLGVVALIATLLLGLVIGSHLGGSPAVLGATPADQVTTWIGGHFTGDLRADTTTTVNNLVITGTAGGFSTSTLTSLTVTNATSTNLAVTGQAVISGTATILQTGSSTLAIGGLSNPGCSAYGDVSSSTLINYVTYSSGVQTVTTTKPAICK